MIIIVRNQSIPSDDSTLKLLTRTSLDLTWRGHLTNDWLPEDKAKLFPVDRFLVDMKWTKVIKGFVREGQQAINSIYQALKEAGKKPFKLLIQGMIADLKFQTIIITEGL